MSLTAHLEEIRSNSQTLIQQARALAKRSQDAIKHARMLSKAAQLTREMAPYKPHRKRRP